MYIYIYIYIEREREMHISCIMLYIYIYIYTHTYRERDTLTGGACAEGLFLRRLRRKRTILAAWHVYMYMCIMHT